jgi:hypothetical protein
MRTQNATSIPEPERGPGRLRVRTVPSAGRGRAVTDRTLRVSGDAWARASASVTGRPGRARERSAPTRTATTASTNIPTTTASITGTDITPLLRS